MNSHLLSKEECTYCGTGHLGGTGNTRGCTAGTSNIGNGSSTLKNVCSLSKQAGGQDQLLPIIQKNLIDKYASTKDFCSLKIVNDLIYNENTHVVSIFKDYLILDDINEFLKRPYQFSETKTRLPKLTNFYEKYSQVFPNYVVLPESKYMFKNIQRKQKIINE